MRVIIDHRYAARRSLDLEAPTRAGECAERGSGIISVNGAAARKAAPGDLLIIATYAMYDEAELAKFEPDLVYVDSRNHMMNQRHKIPVQLA